VAAAFAQFSSRYVGKPGSTLLGRAHAQLLRRSGGRFGRRFLGAEVLVLRTTGRRTGELRETPMFCLPHGDGYAVVASNAASPRPPAWWLNLQAQPSAEALVRGAWQAVLGRRATAAERDELWPRFAAAYTGFDHYEAVATRELPVVVLEPR
jgi:deazaflavin-dependent oxidoreductase (nitroreductase family)